ncbi:arginine--tRNA ligase [Candidatus Saccharibacteria bacterium]|nr:arginine--tRNA ligase [Candidatus Saccharibacteria bacterium]
MKQEATTILTNAVKQLFDSAVVPELSRPDPQFGDFASNVAMQLTRELGRPPRQIAEQLAGHLREQPFFTEVSVAGPGFLNLRVNDQALAGQLARLSEVPQHYAGKTVVAEYSDPNPFKVLHAGHLYTTLVGDVIARLHEVAGATVQRVNFGGDVGLHVGRAMWGIIQTLGGEHPEKLQDIPEAERAVWVTRRYVEGTAAYEENEAAKAEIIAINKKVYALFESGDRDTPFAHIYWTCRQWSYEGFEKLYEQLQVSPFARYLPESECAPVGVDLVHRGLAEGVLSESDGAIVYKGEEQGLHTRVFMTSAGIPTYEAKDLGLAAIKWRDYQFDKGIIITANDIVEYMKVVLKVLGHFHPEVAERSLHITHGLIKLPGGVKMSSRKGNGLLAQDVLDAATEAGSQMNDGRGTDYDVILGAIKYSLLKQRIGGDIIYDPQESVSLEGNSGPYLQYAHARACSILSKHDGELPAVSALTLDEEERILALKLTEYAEVLDRAIVELLPHLICTYLYELTQAFNRFYEKSRVIGDPRQAERLALVTVYADTLRRGLQLLGITAPERL